MSDNEPAWLAQHRDSRAYVRMEWDSNPTERYRVTRGIIRSQRVPQPGEAYVTPLLLADKGFNNHALNTGSNVSPYDEGAVLVGVDGLEIRLLQGVDEASFKRVLSRALRATTGIHPDEPITDLDGDADEMMKGGLQAALETQTIVFQITGASRALTHQLVRSRRAGFHQQSQRATWYGDRPNFREPQSVHMNQAAREAWDKALLACWEAYKVACDNGISYQDARYILPEGTTNYILCEYTIREFINFFGYRGCSMFLWEMVAAARSMRTVLLDAHPFLAPYVKISCEKGSDCEWCVNGKVDIRMHLPRGEAWVDGINDGDDCPKCSGIGSDRKCTFQGWENVEGVCSFPWAQQSNRTFLPNPRFRIGG